MSRRPPHYCNCGVRIIPHGERCPCQIEAARERNQRYDAGRPSGSARYPAEWRKVRRDFLKANPFCAMPGCSARATTVDHIVPWRSDRVLFWNPRNWQALCTHCHNSIKQRLERAQLRPRP